MARVITKTTAKAMAQRAHANRSTRMKKRPPEMVARHDQEMAELRDRQLAEAEEWIEAHKPARKTPEEKAHERKLAKLQALAAELGVEVPNGNATRPPPDPPTQNRSSAPPEISTRPKVKCTGCGRFMPIPAGTDRSTVLTRHQATNPVCAAVARRQAR